MLFEVKKYEPPVATPGNGTAGLIDDSDIISPATAKLKDVINLVDHGKNVVWVSLGDWSMHQLLQKLLEKIGPADVWLSSYAVSEKPARVLCDLKHTGQIKSLRCIINTRIDVQSQSALSMLRNNCDELKLCHTHAKVTVLKNDQWFLVVGGSANYTANRRIESGYISSNAGIASFNQKWITDELGEKHYNETELEAIEELAAHGFSVDEIARIVPKTHGCFGPINITKKLLNEKENIVYERYDVGFLKSLLKIRQRVFLDAGHGSSPAQALAVKILDAAAFKRDSE